MPRNNSSARRAQRREAAFERRVNALQASSNPNERLLATVASVVYKKAQEDEENRRCDMCHLPKWECQLLGSFEAGGDDHIFSPMSIEAQLRLEESEKQMFEAIDRGPMVKSDDLNGHFSSHKPGCTLNPKVCQATSGGR